METLLRDLPISLLQLPALVVTDANIHSPLWKPATYQLPNATAYMLVEAMLR